MLAVTLKKANPAIAIITAAAIIYIYLIVRLIITYFIWDTNVCLGLLLLPYISVFKSGQLSSRYLVPAFIGAILAIVCPVNTLLFIAVLLALFLFIENCLGKINATALFLILFISPVFHHFTRLVEFPIRVWLGNMVARVLQLAGVEATAAGNQIFLSKYEFSVDPACAGLNMLVISIILCLFIIAFYQKKLGKQLPSVLLVIIICITIGLNIIGNFFRILILILFKIMPGTILHDLTGISCLILYVVLPMMIGVRPVVNYLGKVETNNQFSLISGKYLGIPIFFTHLILLTATIFASMHVCTADSLNKKSYTLNLNGYKKTNLTGNITKFENTDALIYIKPTYFLAPEHNPAICWVGSGYQFTNIRIEVVATQRIYIALLQKGDDKIYTAWWFDNGKTKTINQLTWRWQAAHSGTNFYLINVNAGTQNKLYSTINQLLNQQTVKH